MRRSNILLTFGFLFLLLAVYLGNQFKADLPVEHSNPQASRSERSEHTSEVRGQTSLNDSQTQFQSIAGNRGVSSGSALTEAKTTSTQEQTTSEALSTLSSGEQ